MKKATKTLMRTYFSGNKVAREIPYIGDEKDGVEQEFYENGKLKRVVPWNKDKIDGEVKEYNQNGFLLKTTIYENGRKITVLRETLAENKESFFTKLKKSLFGK